MPDSIRLVPLGGLGEIGMNCMALEHDEGIVLIDCGVMFPSRELGVDVIHPDFQWIAERRDRLRGVVLTHGHEDHIGAVPYLLREATVPVWGPPYALGLVRHRLSETGGADRVALHPTEPRRRFEIGPFGFQPLRVAHSMPDATALVIDSPAGVLVHSGDFKIDETPGIDGFDTDGFQAVGDSGVRLLMSDSTNVDFEGPSGRESEVAETLLRLVSDADHRVIVCLFASNVHRIGATLRAARQSGRKVCLLGRSLGTHVRVASELGYLDDPAGLLVPVDRARKMPRSELLVLATGTQGETAAALSRLARGTHPDLTLEPGDEVILSARVIPGHEQTVYGMVNNLLRRGIAVHSRLNEPGVHVSGHACRSEQRRLLELLRPRAFLPVHGTYHHLMRHAELARDQGVEEAVVVENGTVLSLDDTGLKVTGSAPVGRVHVDAGEPIPEIVLKDRALLAELGIALVIVTVDRDGQPMDEPEVVTRGVVHEELEPELLAGAREYVAEAVRRLRSPRLGFDEEALREEARRALRRFFRRRIGRKPMTYAVVVRVP